MKKRLILCLLPIITSLVACNVGPTKGATYKWEIENARYENFTDLGNYVIDVDTHTNFDFKRALAYSNARLDKWSELPSGGCTALGKRINSGDVVIGRNLDLPVSHYPCYITHVNPVDGFKYKNINFTYDRLLPEGDKYDDLKRKSGISEEYYNALPLLASDSFNEKGLYIQYNMRDYEEYMICSGTNPNLDNRICTVCVPFIVTASCATVKEAVNLIKNDLNVYTMLDKSVASGWNLCFMIGDATGEYGLIEIAHNEVMYLPFQQGQSNYYITPKWNVLSKNQTGYGRLQYGLERIDQVQYEEDMTKLIEKIMWRNEILDIEYATQDFDKDGNPGQVHFIDKDGNPSLDWRSDNIRLIPVDDNGNVIDIYSDNPTHELAGYVSKLKEAYNRVEAGSKDPDDLKDAEEYQYYLDNENVYWASDDRNFQKLQKGLMDYYKKTGIKEKLLQYIAGNEKPLRDHSEIWTTTLSITCNCTQKRLTARFWEHKNTIMIWQF